MQLPDLSITYIKYQTPFWTRTAVDYQLLLNDKLADGAGAGWLAASHTLGYGLCALLVPLASKTGVSIALIVTALFAAVLFTIVSACIWHYRTIK